MAARRGSRPTDAAGGADLAAIDSLDAGLSGARLRGAFRAGYARLEERREAVNALNVFPVPDGDTGTNMCLTLRAGVERCPEGDEVGAGAVAQELAQGAFFGARGNSGVILSQFFRGFADALNGIESCTAADLARGLEAAREAAYGAVGTPREGTMLTVIRGAASSALAATGCDEVARPEVADTLEGAYRAACIALKGTPELLPVLKEAGVVDSGGLGVALILGGVLESLAPERFGAVSAAAGLEGVIDDSMASLGGGGPAQGAGYLHQTLEADWGYCTEFIISGENLDLGELRRHYEATARSTVVAGDRRQVRVHIHADDPGPAISYAVALGAVSNFKIENMDEQNADWAAYHSNRGGPGKSGAGPTAALAVAAVAAGDGLAELFRGAGCGCVIAGGQTMNPSVQDLMDGVRRAGAENVIILPNNKNIVLTAQQVAANDPSVHVIPARSIPQGVAAMMAYNPLSPLADNLAAMERALPAVTVIEVTRAVRDTSVDGVAVRRGDYIALLDDRLALAAESAESALERVIDLAGPGVDAILTIYQGADAVGEAADACVAGLEARHPGLQVDRVYGGQPHYHYLASLE